MIELMETEGIPQNFDLTQSLDPMSLISRSHTKHSESTVLHRNKNVDNNNYQKDYHFSIKKIKMLSHSLLFGVLDFFFEYSIALCTFAATACLKAADTVRGLLEGKFVPS